MKGEIVEQRRQLIRLLWRSGSSASRGEATLRAVSSPAGSGIITEP